MSKKRKTKSYFDHARSEILPYLPNKVERILEIGAASGATYSLIKQRFPNAWGFGIEPDQNAVQSAAKVFDIVKCGFVDDIDIESEIAPRSLDLILCLDVLEHLVDPWAMVKKLTPLLKQGGRLIVSVPNVRNFKFLMGVLFAGDFRYKDAGILDRTHLRFFTFETAMELATCGGLKPLHLIGAQTYKPFSAKWILKYLSFGGLETINQKQVLAIAECAD